MDDNKGGSAGIDGLVESFVVGVLELRPGDVLIVKVPLWARPDDIDRTAATLSRVLPDGVKFVFTSTEVDFFVLRQAGLDALTAQLRRLDGVLGGDDEDSLG